MNQEPVDDYLDKLDKDDRIKSVEEARKFMKFKSYPEVSIKLLDLMDEVKEEHPLISANLAGILLCFLNGEIAMEYLTIQITESIEFCKFLDTLEG